ncbi:hypothetical protein [Microbacterium sp.]|uniref:hypothetical protein n=1 Tax=Microbacterium sp. TaxID=51671 RepID=UPI002CCD3A94|nr:hypothetical protein [Microbacterium sp.]HWK76912.1 hypothetical protein [Microbacterium sp.]
MNTTWPGDSATVVRWLRATLHAEVADSREARINGLDDVKIAADLSGKDLQHLTLDATRVRLQFDWRASPDLAARNEAARHHDPQPVSEEPGTIQELRIRATPIRIEGTDVNIDVQAFDVPILWQIFAAPTDPRHPESINGLSAPDDLSSARGSFSASVRTQDLVPLLTSVLRPALAEVGIRLGRVKLDVTGDGSDGIHVTAYAGGRWKLLLASAHADAKVRVTRDAVITVNELTLGSRNPLVALALRFTRKHVREVVGKPYDLNRAIEGGARGDEQGATSARIYDLRVATGEDFSVSGRVN